MSPEETLTDRELTLVRLRFIDLLKSFFQQEPDAEIMSRWRGIFTALMNERINPELDNTISGLNSILATKKLQDLQSEYYSLFTDPYSKYLVPLTASYYLDGKSFGPSLVSYRELLKNAQLVKHKDITDPEDALVLMLDGLAAMIEAKRQNESQPDALQKELVLDFLIPTANKLSQNIAKNDKADFYKHCVGFLCGYLELEEGIIQNPDH